MYSDKTKNRVKDKRRSRNILRIDQGVEGNNINRIETERVRPIQIDQNSATFIFRNKGMLDKHTAISLPVTGSDVNQFLPISTGIMSLIQSASLRVGGQELCSSDEVGGYYAMRSLFKNQEVRERLELPRKGVFTAIRNSTTETATNPSGKQRVEGGVSYTAGVGTPNSKYILTNSADTTARFYFTLEDLFPHLFRALQLPLQFIRDEVSLVLQFSKNTATKRDNHRCCPTGVNAQGTCNILTNEVEMLVDYLFYNDVSDIAKEVMGDGKVLQYADLITNKLSLPKLGVTPAGGAFQRNTYQRNIGMTNRVIRSMYLAQVGIDNASSGTSRNKLMNRYHAQVGSVKDRGETLQIKINDQPLFQSAVDMDGQKYSLLEESMGMPLEVPNGAYTHYGSFQDTLATSALGGNDFDAWANNNAFSTDTLYAHENTNLTGQMHYLGVNLHKPSLMEDGSLQRLDVPNAGMLCGDSPIQLTLTRDITSTDNQDRELFVWSVVEKQSIIKNGQFFTNQV